MDCMVRHIPDAQHIAPGYTIIRPNREKTACKVTRAIVVLILLVSTALMLIVTIGGWSKLQGLKPVNFAWCIAYLVIAFYVARWRRGMLPIAAALAILLLIVSLIATTGVSGTSWVDRGNPGFAPAHSPFGGKGLSPDALGLATALLVPAQALLILFAMQGFAQRWNVELEVPIEKPPRRRGDTGRPAKPAAA
jgi:hypothetical protein